MSSLKQSGGRRVDVGSRLFDCLLLTSGALLVAVPLTFLFATRGVFARVCLAYTLAVTALWLLAVFLPMPPEAGQ